MERVIRMISYLRDLNAIEAHVATQEFPQAGTTNVWLCLDD